MNLYLVTNELGAWYIVSTDPTAAEKLIENALDVESYGSIDNRKVTNIKLLAQEITPALNSKYFFSSGNTLLIGEK